MRGMKRPVAVVLPESAAVPPRNVRPAPAHFTHEVGGPAPFWFEKAGAKEPDGHLRPGSKVLIDSRDGKYVWITDERGLHVQTEPDGIVPLT